MKRYTEKEVLLILSKAAELAGSTSSVDRVENGLTLSEITSIALEAGIDADSIARAARLIPRDDPPSLWNNVMGGTLRARQALEFPGELTTERAHRILHSARRALETHGVGSADASGVSWSTAAAPRVMVSAHGEGAETRVHVSVDHRAAMFLPVMLAGVGPIATLYAAVAAGDSGLVNPYLVLGAGAMITAAAVWSTMRRIARSTRGTLERLIDAIVESIDGERGSPD